MVPSNLSHLPDQITRPRLAIVILVGLSFVAGVVLDSLADTLDRQNDRNAVAVALIISAWGLLATYLVFNWVLDVDQTFKWRRSARVNLGHVERAMRQVDASFSSTVGDGTAVRDADSAATLPQDVRYRAVQGATQENISKLRRQLKSFDAMLDKVAFIFSTTPDMGQGYAHLTLWRFAMWRAKNDVAILHGFRDPNGRDVTVESQHENLVLAEAARRDWLAWLHRNRETRKLADASQRLDPSDLAGLASPRAAVPSGRI